MGALISISLPHKSAGRAEGFPFAVLAGEGCVHNACLHLAALGVGDGNGYLWVAVGVVYGAIDWVNHPQRRIDVLGLSQVGHGFFRQNAMFRKTPADGIGNELVRHYIGVSHQLGLLFVIGTQGVVIALVTNQLSGVKGQGLGEIGDLVQGNRIRHGASWPWVYGKSVSLACCLRQADRRVPSRRLRLTLKRCSKPVGIKFGVHYLPAQHNDAPAVAFFAGAGEVKHETSPYPQLSAAVAFYPYAAQIHSLIQQHYIHGFAVALGRNQHSIFDSRGPPPVPDGEANNKQPKQIEQRQCELAGWRVVRVIVIFSIIILMLVFAGGVVVPC